MRKDRSPFVFVGLICLLLGNVIVLGGCGTSSSATALPSAKQLAQEARQIELNNKKHIQEAKARAHR